MNKQIEEMRKDIYECDPTECCFGDQCEKCPKTEIAKALYNAGYRRQAEVAREIFKKVKNAWAETFTESEFLEILKNLQKEYENED